MEWIQWAINGGLIWRESLWLWGLGLPLLLWLLKKIGRKKQQQAYADSQLWPWVSAQVSLQSLTDARNATDKPTRPGRFWMAFKTASHRLRGLILSVGSPSKMLSLGWLCLIIALAGPRSLISAPDVQTREGVDIVVAMDLSHSMSAQDVYPDRFQFARSLVESMSNQLELGDRLALQGFAGQAHMVSPLSYDRHLFQHALNLIEPNLLPIQGSWLQRAVIEGLNHLAQAAGHAKVMVLFTNGAPEFWQPVALPQASLSSPFASSQRQDDTGVKVIIVGVGKPGAATLPDEMHKSGKLHANGLLVQSRLEETGLKKMAQTMQGIYLRAEPGPDFMKRLLSEIALPAEKRSESQAHYVWKDYAWPFMVAGLVCLLVAFYLIGLVTGTVSQQLRARLNVITQRFSAKQLSIALLSAAVLLSLTVLPEPAQAGSTSSNSGHKAYQAYQAEDYELAQSLYDQQQNYEGWFGAGTAAYKTGDLESAVLYFRQAAWGATQDGLRASALFNLGNSYYQVNLLPQAIESYQQALLYRPDYPQALNNLAIAKQRKLTEDQAKRKEKDSGGDDQDKGGQGNDSDGAFYGGQKPNASDSDEAGSGADGDALEGSLGGETVSLPQSGETTDYRLSAPSGGVQLNALSGSSVQATAIVERQRRQQRAQLFEHELQQLDDDQKTLLKRMFEREAGFHAAQDKPHPIPGVQPW